MTKKRIVVTGMGALTPLGLNVKETWEGIVKGKSGIAPISLFDASTFPVRIAGEVKNFEPPFLNSSNGLKKFLSRAISFCVSAARMAAHESGLNDTKIEPLRLGVSLGTGEEHSSLGLLDTIFGDEKIYNCLSDSHNYYFDESKSLGHVWALRRSPYAAATVLSLLFNAQGPNSTSVTACASSGQAIGKAMKIIEDGDADIMIAGGCEALITEFTLAGFDFIGALSRNNEKPRKASKPFDLKRDGFILSEGAGILILEELNHAKKRGAEIIAELAGYGSSSNAYRITDSPPDGRGPDLAITSALKDAKKSVDDIDYINAHGTATSLNDRSETASIKKVFNSRAHKIPISSNKSMTGHTIAASAAIELIISILTIRNNLIPPTINLENPDSECDLDYVPLVAREKKVDVVLSNSFAFCGQNACLVVERYAG